MKGVDVIVVGGGAIGGSVAYFLAREKLRPLILERGSIACEASGANAGLVGATGGEPHPTIIAFREAGLRWLARLQWEWSESFELTQGGRLSIALDDAEMKHIRDEVQGRQREGQNVQLLDAAEVQALEPCLRDSPVVGGAIAPNDGHVNPFLLTYGYVKAARHLGATVRTGANVTELIVQGDRVRGVRVGDEALWADAVVLATGAWLTQLTDRLGLPPMVYPGRGQMLVTQALPFITRRVVHGALAFRQAARGNLLVGSTVEDAGFSKGTTTLLCQFAAALATYLPQAARVQVIRTWAGLRPMSVDGFPVIGPVPGVEGLWLASGLGRSGLTWSGITGEVVAGMMCGRTLPLEVTRVLPARFLRPVGATAEHA